jgi:UDP-N-acetylmuramyl pentapeptide phosphotransferase/UDP-N-acetylglucosamine-1-phosphate transferase/glycosyltransferase involved in cell wall biosynthesis
MVLIYVAVFALACLVSLFATGLSMTFARRVGLLDTPDARKVHVQATPRLGGIGIVVGTLAIATPAVLLLCASSAPDLPTPAICQPMLGILLGTICIFCVGLCDDLFGVASKIKLIAIIAASFAVCGAGASFGSIRTDGNVLLDFSSGSWIATTIWIAGITVAFMFIDGLDGLAGGLGLIASAVLATFLIAGGQHLAAVAPLALAGSIIGFLYYNWHPARTFMGDCGSMTLGFMIGALTAAANPSIGTMRGMILPALGVSVALVDTALTLFRRRYQQRRSMFAAERGHIHHRLLDKGLSHPQAVLVIHGVSVLAVLVGVVSLAFDGWATFGGIVLVVPLLWMLFHMAGSVRTGEMAFALKRKREHDRKSRRFQNEFEALQLEFDATRTFDQWWSVVCSAAERLHFSSVELPAVAPYTDSARKLRWQSDNHVVCHEHIDAKIPVTMFGADEPAQNAAVRVPADCLESAGYRLALFSRLLAENGRNALRNIHFATKSQVAIEALVPACELGKVRVAVVHDFFDSFGGPERVVAQILNIFPHSDLFAITDFLPADQREFIHEKPVTTTFVQKLPGARRRPFRYLPLLPLAIEQLDLSSYDLVISSSQLVAKGVSIGPHQLHISYCHSPLRYGCDLHDPATRFGGGIAGGLSHLVRHYMRNWDVRASHGVDIFLANSRHVAQRIEKLYRRPATVIYPPIDTNTFVPASDDDNPITSSYYLAATRLLAPKRVDLLIEAFAKTPDRRLIVIGDGPERKRLAPPNVELVGSKSPQALAAYLQRARAFVSAAGDDLTLTAIESLACGTPVIAFRTAALAEFIKTGRTGYLFHEPTTDSLLAAIDQFEAADPLDDLDRKAARQRAERFATDQFIERFTDVVRREIRARWSDRLDPPNTPAPESSPMANGAKPPTKAEPDKPASAESLAEDFVQSGRPS